MRDTIHEVLVDLRADTVARGGRRSGRPALRVADGRLAVHDDFDEALGIVDAGGNVRGVERLAVEAAELDTLVRCDDDALARSDLLRGERVLRTHGALGLDLDGVAHLARHLLEVLGGHVGVRNARGTRGDCKDLRQAAVLRGCCGSGLCSCLGLLFGVVGSFRGIDRGKEFVYRRRRAKRRRELGVHEERRELGEHLEVHVRLRVGSGDEEDEVGGFAVGRLPVHAAGHGDRHETGLAHSIGFGMRNRHALAHGGGELSFACEHGLLVAVAVCDGTDAALQIDEDIVLRRGDDVELHALLLQQSCDLHANTPFSAKRRMMDETTSKDVVRSTSALD